MDEGGNLIETYKILRGRDRIDAGRMFPMESRPGDHSLRIQGRPFRTEVRRHFFTQRVVSLWNALPQEVVDAKTLNIFKRRLYIALGVNGIKDYGEKAELGH